ncbi:cell division protein ZapB [Trichlorobacter lovleyi]|uniref:cell division protein ZapB n=1 Tax=Trichlorobacter lovleyi TaxID=313985 RepID=UPI0024800347|nr:cell division protein ZapB [Trichlorobacter lovleyi]
MDALMQMGLDFIQENQYIIAPSEGDTVVEAELFEKLEEKISTLLSNYAALKEEKRMLAEENARLQQEREGLKGRIDSILSRLEGV